MVALVRVAASASDVFTSLLDKISLAKAALSWLLHLALLGFLDHFILMLKNLLLN